VAHYYLPFKNKELPIFVGLPNKRFRRIDTISQESPRFSEKTIIYQIMGTQRQAGTFFSLIRIIWVAFSRIRLKNSLELSLI
jgi:hypothetical protein